MKKLALILLIGIYSTAVFGGVSAAVSCCDNVTSPGINLPKNLTGIITAATDDCSNTHSAAFTNHHIAASSIHFSFRNYYNIQPHTGFAGIAIAAITRRPLFSAYKNNSIIAVGDVPVYILHCVYRL